MREIYFRKFLVQNTGLSRGTRFCKKNFGEPESSLRSPQCCPSSNLRAKVLRLFFDEFFILFTAAISRVFHTELMFVCRFATCFGIDPISAI